MKRRRIRLDANTITWIVLAGVGIYLAVQAWHSWQDREPWVDPVFHIIVHTGLKETLRLAVLAVVGSAAIGIVLGTVLTIRFLPTRALIRFYIEVWRGLPIVVTIFLIYFALPSTPIYSWLSPVLPGAADAHLSAFAAGAIGLTLWGSAQVAEATRGAVQSIPREQHEAAAALGFGWIGRHAFVVLPQALRRLLPPIVSLLVNVIQNTTIVALIGVAEVLETGNRSVERLTFTTADPHAFEIFAFVMVIFFVISFPLTRLSAFLERRLV